MTYDYVLVGGGLQNGLIASALLTRRSGVKLALIERGTLLGGNHLWSFHAGDIPNDARAFVNPLVAHHWARYRVAFPRLERVLDEAYGAIPSTRFDQVIRARMESAAGCALMLGAEVAKVAPREVTLASGERISGRLIIDARGPGAMRVESASGYQKFLGLEVRIDPRACPREPTLMDATVAQRDGLRFVYVLPLERDRVLVEDTYFSDTPSLALTALRERVLEYMRACGMGPLEVLREETGVLPMPWDLEPAPPRPGLLVAGYQGGWFHPATGYSMPVAVRLANVVARHDPDALISSAEFRSLVAAQERQHGFLLLLNRLLFTAYPPGERWNVMERFYRLPVATIRRFYAMDLRFADRLRILSGRPPRGLSLRRAWTHMEAAR